MRHVSMREPERCSHRQRVASTAVSRPSAPEARLSQTYVSHAGQADPPLDRMTPRSGADSGRAYRRVSVSVRPANRIRSRTKSAIVRSCPPCPHRLDRREQFKAFRLAKVVTDGNQTELDQIILRPAEGFFLGLVIFCRVARHESRTPRL